MFYYMVTFEQRAQQISASLTKIQWLKIEKISVHLKINMNLKLFKKILQ